MEDEIFNKVFSDTEYIFLDSGMNLLKDFTNECDLKEKYRRFLMIRELAKKKCKTTILDDIELGALIKEIKDINTKKQEPRKNVKSFKDLMYEEERELDAELIKSNFIYNSGVIYVDAIRDINLIDNQIYRQLKIIEQEHNIHSIQFSNAMHKPKVFRNRYSLVRYFLLQNPEFKTKFTKDSDGIEISTLDCLLGNNEKVFVLGMLCLNEEGTLQLQDNTKIITLDISECEWGRGYFPQGSIVLTQGFYKNEVLKANVIVHPTYSWKERTFKERYECDFFGAITKSFITKPENSYEIKINKSKNNTKTNNLYEIHNSTENRNNVAITQENYLLNFLHKNISENKNLYPKILEEYLSGNLDFLIKNNFNPNISERVFNTTGEYLTEEFMLIISNPDLTNQSVLNAIDKILTGYNSAYNNSKSLPFMIVFIGNFVPENSFCCFKTYMTSFENLANIILKSSHIAKYSYLVFIPGPDDFSLFSGFPKHPIIETVINPIKKKLPNIINGTNPCRLSIFGKEFVFFRDNLNKKLSRNSVVKCEDITKNKEYYVHTVLAQGSLAPVDLSVSPQMWHHSQAMMILPLPQYLVLADVVEDFYMTNNFTTVVNPGNFTKDFSFCVVFPLKNVVEPCKINI
jgi:hypothetical protein